MRRLLVLLGLLLAGCTVTQAGTPSSGGRPGGEAPSTRGPTTTTGAVPSRPRNLDMAAVDICGVVASLPRAEYGLDTDRAPVGGASSLFPGSRDCYAGGIQDNLGLLVVAVVGQGVPEYLDGANAEVRETEAAGFPLFVLTTPSSRDSCFGVLDVNDGQMLFVNYSLTLPAAEPRTPQATLCARVPDIARAVLSLL